MNTLLINKSALQNALFLAILNSYLNVYCIPHFPCGTCYFSFSIGGTPHCLEVNVLLPCQLGWSELLYTG